MIILLALGVLLTIWGALLVIALTLQIRLPSAPEDQPETIKMEL